VGRHGRRKGVGKNFEREAGVSNESRTCSCQRDGLIWICVDELYPLPSEMATTTSDDQHASDGGSDFKERLTRPYNALDRRRRAALAEIDNAKFSSVVSASKPFCPCLLISTQVVPLQSVRGRRGWVLRRCVSPSLPSPDRVLVLIFSAQVMTFSRMPAVHNSCELWLTISASINIASIMLGYVYNNGKLQCSSGGMRKVFTGCFRRGAEREPGSRDQSCDTCWFVLLLSILAPFISLRDTGSLLGQLLFGYLADHVGRRFMCAFNLSLLSTALMSPFNQTDGNVLVYVLRCPLEHSAR
jgi:hypothetical protein